MIVYNFYRDKTYCVVFLLNTGVIPSTSNCNDFKLLLELAFLLLPAVSDGTLPPVVVPPPVVPPPVAPPPVVPPPYPPIGVQLQPIPPPPPATNKIEDMDEDKELIENYPYSQMAKLEWVETSENPLVKVKELRKFFEVVKLSIIDNNLLPGIVYKKHDTNNENYFSLITWTQKAKLEARSIKTKPINIDGIKDVIPNILNTESNNVVELLAEYGVALVVLPKFNNTKVHGATFLDNKKIVIALIDDDNFYSNLFHEIGHILLGHINKDYIPDGNEERDAEAFSKSVLLS